MGTENTEAKEGAQRDRRRELGGSRGSDNGMTVLGIETEWHPRGKASREGPSPRTCLTGGRWNWKKSYGDGALIWTPSLGERVATL